MTSRRWREDSNLRPDLALYYSPLLRVGGAERQWAGELRGFRSLGIRAVGIAYSPVPDALNQLSVNPADVQLLEGDTRGLSGFRAYRRWLTGHRPKMVVAHTGLELTYLATRGLNIPFVWYQNSPVFYEGYAENPYPFAWQHRSAYRKVSVQSPAYLDFAKTPNLSLRQRVKLEGRAWLKSRALKRAAAIVALSRRTVGELAEMYGVSSTVVRGCLDERVFSLVPEDIRSRHGLKDRPLLVSICRLDPVKRIDLLLRAFAQARAVIPRLALVVGGAGQEQARLEALARDLGIERDVVFTGYLDDAVVWHYYAAADLFVTPATADYNIAPYEALALGRKVVVSTELEIEDWLVSGGWVFRAEPNVPSLVDTIRAALAANPGRPLDLSSLSWSARVRSLLELFQQRCPELALPSPGSGA
jgi:glycosyltransferase involved in cell wall biosynthesis